MEEYPPAFCIGHHDTKHPPPATAQTIRHAHDANYDMVTCPITTDYFHSRVLALLSSSLSQPQERDPWKFGSGNHSSISIPPFSPLDTTLTPDQAMSQIIATTSAWTDLGSPDPIIADLSRQILKLELTYAAFCGITYVLIPAPRIRRHGFDESGLVQYARAIVDALNHGPYMQIHIWLPMIDLVDAEDEKMGDLAPFARQEYQESEDQILRRLDLFGTWTAWNVIRSMCKYHSRLCIALSLPKFLPPVSIQSRWHSEPVRIFTLHVDVFSKNPKGYPVLSKAHQALISRFTRLRNPPWFLLCDVGPFPQNTNVTANAVSDTIALPLDGAHFPSLSEAQSTAGKDQTPHLSYMRNLQNKQPAQTQLEKFGAGYQDYLQAPLQPLTVNLESITYEVFEKDPIKYDWYEKAIARALHDWIEQGKPTSGPDGRVVVAVVGAGRGPLVSRALKAGLDVGVEIDMWALEKNPNAFVLLQRHNETIWDHRVSLVKSDMRTWRGPFSQGMASQPLAGTKDAPPDHGLSPKGEHPSVAYTGDLDVDKEWLMATARNIPTHYKVDILISELLGSFADNELSPECLDGVQHLINPVHGISIPASYTAHLSPIGAPKLHADILNQSISNPNAPETPYVVMLHAIDHLSTSQQSSSPPTAAAAAAAAVASYSTTPAIDAQRPNQHHHHQTSAPTNTAAPPPPPSPITKCAWSFHHPNPFLPLVAANTTTTTTSTSTPSTDHPPPTIPTNSHNTRHASLAFPIPNRGTCHGLAGYFETVLYAGAGPGPGAGAGSSSSSNKVELSTNPATMAAKSDGMISWFPIYFPLKSPIFAPDDSEILVHMWRQTDERKVWYEWMVEVYAAPTEDKGSGHGHGVGAGVGAGRGRGRGKGAGTGQGRAGAKKIRIGGSELHSSIKEACLM